MPYGNDWPVGVKERPFEEVTLSWDLKHELCWPLEAGETLLPGNRCQDPEGPTVMVLGAGGVRWRWRDPSGPLVSGRTGLGILF